VSLKQLEIVMRASVLSLILDLLGPARLYDHPAPHPRRTRKRRVMAKTYRVTPATRLINRIFSLFTRLGLGASYRHILTVPGRKTGRLYSTPVDIIEFDGERWLIAGYGPATWTKNVRAAGEVTLTRGGASRRFAAETETREEVIRRSEANVPMQYAALSHLRS
jgi:deazaflavin-dependent oxidoreductase (nitroreductase family)